MKGLTQQEMTILLKAEDILFFHLDDGELGDIFSKSAIELYKAKKKYIRLMIKEVGDINKKSIVGYCNSDVIALNDAYNEIGGE